MNMEMIDLKKFITVASFVFLLMILIQPAKCQEDIKVYYNSMEIEFDDVPPIVESGRTLVPFRKLAQALGVNVEYISDSKKIFAHNMNIDVQMTISQEIMYIDRNPYKMLVAPNIVGDRTVIPLRDFSQAFGLEVHYNDKLREIQIVDNKEYEIEMNIDGFYALGTAHRSSWEELFGESYPDVSSNPKLELYRSVYLGWYELRKGVLASSGGAHGFNKPAGFQNVINNISKNGKEPIMMIFAEDSGDLVNQLTSTRVRQSIISSIIDELDRYGYKGVNLDFEGLGLSSDPSIISNTRKAYSSFVAALHKELNGEYKLVITTPPGNSAYQGYDFKELARYADQIVVMSYDYHDRSLPSATAPIEKVREGLEIISNDVPGSKISMGIRLPAIRYQRGATENNDVLGNDPAEEIVYFNWQITHPYLDSVMSFIAKEDLQIKWHPESSVSYVEFNEENSESIIFMESEESIKRKIMLVDELALDGVSLWRIGTVPNFVYDTLNNAKK